MCVIDVNKLILFKFIVVLTVSYGNSIGAGSLIRFTE